MDDNRPSGDLAGQIAALVERRLGASDPELHRIIGQEIQNVLAESRGSGDDASRVVVTANGSNRPGIVARLAAAIDEFSGDIRDLSQTIVGGYFTMIFVVDIANAPHEGARFMQLRKRLKEVGDDMGVHVVAIHDDILSTMHSV